MSSGDRFYQLELRHRPVLRGDIGSLLCRRCNKDKGSMHQYDWCDLRVGDKPRVLHGAPYYEMYLATREIK